MKDLKYLVIAGNYREYIDFLNENKLNRKEARFCNKPQDLHGIHFVPVIFYGEASRNPLYNWEYLQCYIELNENPNK